MHEKHWKWLTDSNIKDKKWKVKNQNTVTVWQQDFRMQSGLNFKVQVIPTGKARSRNLSSIKLLLGYDIKQNRPNHEIDQLQTFMFVGYTNPFIWEPVLLQSFVATIAWTHIRFFFLLNFVGLHFPPRFEFGKLNKKSNFYFIFFSRLPHLKNSLSEI